MLEVTAALLARWETSGIMGVVGNGFTTIPTTFTHDNNTASRQIPS